MKKLDFIYFDAGGGHRAAANALRQVMEGKWPFEIRMVNLQEVLDGMDVFRKLTGIRLQDIYNLLLKKGWTLGSPQLMMGMHLVIRLFHRQSVRLLEDFWKREPAGPGCLAGAEFRPAHSARAWRARCPGCGW